MRIVHINTFSNGSTGKIARNLIINEIAEGHESTLVYARGPKVSDVPNLRISNALRVRADALLSRIFDNQGLNSKGSTRKLVKWMREYKPDLVHLHNIHGYYMNYKILFRYLTESGVQVEWTLHDCWAFTGHCAYYSFCDCKKWKSLCNHCPQKKSYPKAVFVDRSKKNYKLKKEVFTNLDVNNVTLITPSYWLAGQVNQSFLSKYKVIVRHNQIDENIFKITQSDFKNNYGLSDKKIVLGVAGVWDQRKGLQYFVELDKKLDHKKYSVVVVGVSQKQKKQLDKNTNIISICRTENQIELAKIYTAADVFFNPTLEENYPTVNLEAQACGTMVVSFDTGGCKETDLKKGLFKLVDKNNYFEEIVRNL